MPTLIDSLVVKLGLDPSDLNRQASSGTNKLREIQTQGDKTEKSVSDLSATMGKFLALIGGTVAIKRFVEDTVDANAALERLSKNIGINVSEISAWGNAVELAGGSAKDIQGTLQMLSKAQTEFKVTGESSLIPYFSALGLSFAEFARSGKPVTDSLLQIQDRIKSLGLNRNDQFNFLQMMGIDSSTANVLLDSTRRELEAFIAKQKEFNAVTPKQAEEAVKLQKGFIALKQEFIATGRELLSQATPGLLKLLDILTQLGDWVRNNIEFVKDLGVVLGTIAAGLTAISIASSPITLMVVGVLALAAAIALLWQDYQTWKRGGDSLIDWGAWEPAIDAATAGVKALTAVIKGLWAAIGENPTVQNFFGKLKAGFDESDTKKLFGGSGERTATAQRIKKLFEKQGWSSEQAAGLAANAMAESSGKVNALGDGKQAYGLLQWHPDRQKDFENFAGKSIQGSSLEEQIAFANFELTRGKEKKAGDRIRGATTAEEAGSLASKYYIRPKDREGEAGRRGSLAGSIAGIPGAAGDVAGANMGTGDTDRSVTLNVDRIDIHTQATEPQGIARDFVGNVQNYLLTSQANAGLR